jgi:alanine-synthesizing transaminase
VFSRRSAVPHAVDPLFLEIERARAEHRITYDLTSSNPTNRGLSYPRAAIASALADTDPQGYQPEPLGDVRARRALVELWRGRGVEVSEEQIVLTASTSEAYSLLCKLFCDDQSSLLVPAPSYPLFAELLRYENVALESYRLAFDGAWHVDFDSLERALSPRVKAIVSVSPNNPTGSCCTRDEFERLASYGIPLISDEVFWAYPVERPTPSLSALSVSNGVAAESSLSAGVKSERARLIVALDGLSKFAGLPGIKLGWLTLGGEPGLVREATRRLEFLCDAYLSVNAPAQKALPRLLATSEGVRREICERLQLNLALLDRALVDAPLSRYPVAAGWSVAVRVPRVCSESEWVRRLLDNGILVQPGWFYDFEVDGILVLSLLTEPTIWSSAVEELVRIVTLDSRG